MSTKTIAIDSRVYGRLAAAKREGESFSKVIDRLIDVAASAHSGKDILQELEGFETEPPEDAEVFLAVIAENRATESWDPSD